jgi:hypothetical protein
MNPEANSPLSRAPLVWVEGGFFIFRDERLPGFRYDFDCQGPADAIRWIEHLSKKTWITKEHILQFSILVMHEFGVSRR